MAGVTPKKSLGQHFLSDRNIARRISDSLTGKGYSSVLEIGPGTGVLTGYLIERNFSDFRVIEIDNESVHFLRNKFPDLGEVIRGDFLKTDLDILFANKIGIIGNFPYNISSQILFHILHYRDKVAEVCAMLQREVAWRICSPPGSKAYGILSVLLQAYYDAEYLFTVPETVFIPPPKVKSGVIRLTRNASPGPGCDERLFAMVVKAAFNQRRKTLRNSIGSAFRLRTTDFSLNHLRPEQLSVQQFAELTRWVEENMILSE